MTLSSCSNNDVNYVKSNIIGTWILDSSSTPRGQYLIESEQNEKIIKFLNKSDYSLSFWSGDVGGGNHGKYFITNNPKRGITVTLIPDLITSGNDTIRLYTNFDIVEINNYRLHTISKTEFINNYDLPSRVFNENCIYKKSKK